MRPFVATLIPEVEKHPVKVNKHQVRVINYSNMSNTTSPCDRAIMGSNNLHVDDSLKIDDYIKKRFDLLFIQLSNGNINDQFYQPEANSALLRPGDQLGWSSDEGCETVRTNSDSDSASLNDSGISSPSSKQVGDPDILFKEILEKGVGDEDIVYLSMSFENLARDGQEDWIGKTTWVTPPRAEANHCDCVLENSTGCARTEVYCKSDERSKTALTVKRHIRNSNRPEKPETIKGEMFYNKNYKVRKMNILRDARNEQRRLSTAYQKVTGSGLLKLNELKFRKKKLKLGKSEIHGLGLFAAEPIPPNEFIIEYVGQKIRPIIADNREKQYKSSGIGSYCFKMDEDSIVDATKYGNLNRYINHSCNPNSYARILNIDNQKKIVIYSKKFIKFNEEITYDYKMPLEDEKIVCYCGSRGCRKFLN
uniref:[histone H3]-lysine(4) N-trimethyltransferase n=1 Tax=Cuerna arida TaxID=1464854 RepID=A0A1B6EXM1_9HEMI